VPERRRPLVGLLRSKDVQKLVLKTWNCFGAAQSVAAFLRWRGAPDTHRFGLAELSSSMHEVDILCVQELFLSEAERFFDALPHAHRFRDTNAAQLWPLTFGGSGLGIASHRPILETSVRPFARPHVGVERFARKGMLHARIALDEEADLFADVVTTHMQSGYGVAAGRVRARQIVALAGLVDEVGSPDRPFIVCGDLNIDGLSPARAEGEYARLRDALGTFEDLGADADHATFHPHPEVNELAHRFEATGPRQRIDYVFFRPARSCGLVATECALAFREPFLVPDRGRTFASDHFAVRVVFERRVQTRRLQDHAGVNFPAEAGYEQT
jgi:endonuclease/exonuclease/phosphatase family metal-dependent hydrolase